MQPIYTLYQRVSRVLMHQHYQKTTWHLQPHLEARWVPVQHGTLGSSTGNLATATRRANSCSRLQCATFRPSVTRCIYHASIAVGPPAQGQGCGHTRAQAGLRRAPRARRIQHSCSRSHGKAHQAIPQHTKKSCRPMYAPRVRREAVESCHDPQQRRCNLRP